MREAFAFSVLFSIFYFGYLYFSSWSLACEFMVGFQGQNALLFFFFFGLVKQKNDKYFIGMLHPSELEILVLIMNFLHNINSI